MYLQVLRSQVQIQSDHQFHQTSFTLCDRYVYTICGALFEFPFNFDTVVKGIHINTMYVINMILSLFLFLRVRTASFFVCFLFLIHPITMFHYRGRGHFDRKGYSILRIFLQIQAIFYHLGCSPCKQPKFWNWRNRLMFRDFFVENGTHVWNLFVVEKATH